MKSKDEVIQRFTRKASLYARGIISDRELVRACLEELASADDVLLTSISSLRAALPVSIQADFDTAMREATREDFSYKSFYIGDTRSLEQKRQDDEMDTHKIRAWAIPYVRFLDDMDPDRGP